jgi:hypothetical protein
MLCARARTSAVSGFVAAYSLSETGACNTIPHSLCASFPLRIYGWWLRVWRKSLARSVRPPFVICDNQPSSMLDASSTEGYEKMEPKEEKRWKTSWNGTGEGRKYDLQCATASWQPVECPSITNLASLPALPPSRLRYLISMSISSAEKSSRLLPCDAFCLHSFHG